MARVPLVRMSELAGFLPVAGLTAATAFEDLGQGVYYVGTATAQDGLDLPTTGEFGMLIILRPFAAQNGAAYWFPRGQARVYSRSLTSQGWGSWST